MRLWHGWWRRRKAGHNGQMVSLIIIILRRGQLNKPVHLKAARRTFHICRGGVLAVILLIDIFSREAYMLVLTRKLGESIRIGPGIVVTVLGVNGLQVRLGIEAPKEVTVHRGGVRCTRGFSMSRRPRRINDLSGTVRFLEEWACEFPWMSLNRSGLRQNAGKGKRRWRPMPRSPLPYDPLRPRSRAGIPSHTSSRASTPRGNRTCDISARII